MAQNPLRCEGGPEGVRVAVALASFEEPQGKGDRLAKVARIGGCELVLVVRHRILDQEKNAPGEQGSTAGRLARFGTGGENNRAKPFNTTSARLFPSRQGRTSTVLILAALLSNNGRRVRTTPGPEGRHVLPKICALFAELIQTQRTLETFVALAFSSLG